VANEVASAATNTLVTYIAAAYEFCRADFTTETTFASVAAVEAIGTRPR
jgi:hypothetical protein